MGKIANVQDIDALRHFRKALLKFGEKAINALGEADAEIQRVTMWLENEQTTYWAGEMRKRHAALVKAREDLRFKVLFKSASGGKNSTVDEERAVKIAQARMAEAEQKSAAVKRWIGLLHRESHLYRGSVQRLATTVSVDVPGTAARVLRMIGTLEGYVALKAHSNAPAGPGASAGVGMGGDGAELAGYARLRRLTPGPEEKDKAAPIADPMSPWTCGEIPEPDALSVGALAPDGQLPDPNGTVVLDPAARSAPMIYLERSPAAFPGDTGWYIGCVRPASAAPSTSDAAPRGPAESSAATPATQPSVLDQQSGSTVSTPPTLASMRVAEVLAVRPLFAHLLALPTGTLLVVDSAGIAAVLDFSNQTIHATR